MTDSDKKPVHPPHPSKADQAEQVKRDQSKAETEEVAGRHKNDGQNDYTRHSNKT